MKRGTGTIKMKNKFKRFLSGILIFCFIVNLNIIVSLADTKNSQNAIGMVNSNIPYIQVEIKNNELDKSVVSGKLGSESISLYNLNKVSDQKKLTYIFIDNSSSMTQDNICPKGSFEQLKEATAEFIKNYTDSNNNFSVYSIGDGAPKELGSAKDEDSALKVANSVLSLSGKEDATNLNEALADMFSIASQNKEDYSILKFLLITDSSADYSNGIDVSELDTMYQYNKIPLFTICNTVSENSTSFKQLRTVSRNSGGEGYVFNYNNDSDAYSLINSVYSEMTQGYLATFITNTAADNNTRELIINVKGTDYSETVKLDTAANITADVNANIKVNDSYNAFIISFVQEGFPGNLPVNDNALKSSSYVITKSGKEKPLAIQKVELNSDGSYTVTMKKDIYSGKYDFSFKNITDLSSNANLANDSKNIEISAKNPFWIVFPYIIAIIFIVIVLVSFYLVLLNLKKKKNVKTIKELFETQVNETVEEKHYINNISNTSKEIRLYCQTANSPQKAVTIKVQSSIMVGRSNINNVYINDPKMSRQHFAIEYTDGVFMLSDLESVNGTYINGIKVNGRQRLNSGDMILAGLTKIRIEF